MGRKRIDALYEERFGDIPDDPIERISYILGKKINSEKYNKLTDIDGVNGVQYLYYYYDEKMTYDNNKKFSSTPIIYTTNNNSKYVISNKKKIEDLKENEIMIDEKMAFKNNLKVGDKIKLNYKDLDKNFEYTIVDLCDSSYFTTSRNVFVINYNQFIKEVTDIPQQVHIITSKDTDLEDMKDTLKKEIKEVSIKIQTTKEYIDEQENQTSAIMSIFYVILGLSVFLSFIGIVNNQIISFIQRRRELAVLNSTCMSKSQLRKMLFTETLLANLLSSILVIIVSYGSVIFINYFMQGIDMYITINYNLITILRFVGIIYIILIFTLIIPASKLRKMNIVNEIKYE